jgi:hypothetical protein
MICQKQILKLFANLNKISRGGSSPTEQKLIKQFAGPFPTKYSCLEIAFSAIYTLSYFFIFNITITNDTVDIRVLVCVLTVDKTILHFIIIIIIIIIIIYLAY